MRTMLIAVLAAFGVLCGSPVYAQDAASGSTAQNEVNVVAITGAQGESHVRSSGHIYSTPNVVGGSIIGANDCLKGTSVGGAGGAIGFNISIGNESEHCNAREDAGTFWAMGLKTSALARFCQVRKNAMAFFQEYGKVCPGVPTRERKRYKTADGKLAPYWAGFAEKPAGKTTPPAPPAQ